MLSMLLINNGRLRKSFGRPGKGSEFLEARLRCINGKWYWLLLVIARLQSQPHEHQATAINGLRAGWGTPAKVTKCFGSCCWRNANNGGKQFN